MPNPTPARRAAQAYLVDPFVPTRDTLPCEHCGTTLSNCDWSPDALGRLSLRCPNAHRHGTGWRAYVEYPVPSARPYRRRELEPMPAMPDGVRGMVPCQWPDCESLIAWRSTGKAPKWCPDHQRARAYQLHEAYRERNKAQLAARRRARRSA